MDDGWTYTLYAAKIIYVTGFEKTRLPRTIVSN